MYKSIYRRISKSIGVSNLNKFLSILSMRYNVTKKFFNLKKIIISIFFSLKKWNWLVHLLKKLDFFFIHEQYVWLFSKFIASYFDIFITQSLNILCFLHIDFLYLKICTTAFTMISKSIKVSNSNGLLSIFKKGVKLRKKKTTKIL